MAEQRTKTTTKKRATKASVTTAKPARSTKPTTKTTKTTKKAASASTAPRKTPAKKAVTKKAALAAVPRRSRPVRPETQGPSEEVRELALAAAAAGLDKKAVGVEILDVLGKVDYTDYLVLMTGRSDRHVDSIAQGILGALEKEKGKRALSVEGLQAASWVLIDFGDIVVHVFQEEARETYDIAGLWLDAARLPLPEGAGED